MANSFIAINCAREKESLHHWRAMFYILLQQSTKSEAIWRRSRCNQL